jgi:hypothetical protein
VPFTPTWVALASVHNAEHAASAGREISFLPIKTAEEDLNAILGEATVS